MITPPRAGARGGQEETLHLRVQRLLVARIEQLAAHQRNTATNAYAPETGTATRAPSPQPARPSTRAGRAQRKPSTAENAARHTLALHKRLSHLDPAEHEWKLLSGHAASRFADRLDTLRGAWDVDSDVLLDRELYGAVLDLVDAPFAERRTVWKLYNSAFQATKAVKDAAGPATAMPSTWWLASKVPPRELAAVIAEQLEVVDTEKALMAHLRMLLDFSAHSTRTLQSGMARYIKHAEHSKRISIPAHNTLAAWLKSEKIPRQLTEQVLETMLDVVLESIQPSPLSRATLAAAHLQTYRSLIRQRHIDALHDGPVPRALAALAKEEAALGEGDAALPEDSPERAALRRAREVIMQTLREERELAEHGAPKRRRRTPYPGVRVLTR